MKNRLLPLPVVAAFALLPFSTLRAQDAPAADQPAPADAAPAEEQKPSRPVVKTPDLIKFRQGDQLRGTLLEAHGSDGIKWKTSVARTPIQFNGKNVYSIKLSPRETDKRKDHGEVVMLTNGDEIPGEIVSLDDEYLTINTWHSGELKIHRVMVDSIALNGGGNTLYAGPDELKNWTVGNATQKNAWTFKNDSLICSSYGGIARDVGLAERSKISFDAQWQGYMNMNVTFFAENLEQPTQGNCYTLALTYYSSNLLRHTRPEPVEEEGAEAEGVIKDQPAIRLNAGGMIGARGGRFGNGVNLGQQANLNLRSKTKGKFEIYVDGRSKEFTLAYDGKVIKTWVDSSDEKFDITGKAIALTGQGNGPTRIRNLMVTRWNGVLPNQTADKAKDPGDDPVEAAVEEEAEQELDEKEVAEAKRAAEINIHNIRLRNDDKIQGKLGNILSNKVEFTTTYTSLKFPLERAAMIEVRDDDAELARKRKEDVRAFFVDGGTVTFALDSLDGDKLIGSSENFGKATFSLAAFKELQFDIYSDAAPPTENDDDWSALIPGNRKQNGMQVLEGFNDINFQIRGIEQQQIQIDPGFLIIE